MVSQLCEYTRVVYCKWINGMVWFKTKNKGQSHKPVNKTHAVS